MSISTTNKRIFELDFNRRSVLTKIANEVSATNEENNNNILPSVLRYHLNKLYPYPQKCNKKKTYYITQENIGITGVVLTKPGNYKFASDLVFSPLLDHTQAIIIAGHNITLNLGKYSLIQLNQTPNVYGIVVARGSKYVTITGRKNIAVVRNFTLAGIRIYGRTQYISVEGIITKQNVPVQLTNDQIPVSCFDILQLSLNLGIAIGEGDTFGVHMQGTNKANLVEELNLKNVTCDGSTIGCHMIFTFGFKITKSVFTKNTYYGLLDGTGWVVPGDGPSGLTFPVGGNGTITDCRFTGNKGLNLDLSNPGDLYVYDFVSGIANYEVSNVVIERCLVADNSNNGYIIAADHDAASNIKWNNCVITGTRSVDEPADGLHFSGSIPFTIGGCTGAGYPLIQGFNITVTNCTVTDGLSLGSRSVGFLFAYVQGAHVSNCNASGMNGGGAASGGFYVVGGLPGGRSSDITLINNTAERNCTTGAGRGGGFFIEAVSDNIVMKNNIANANGTSPDLTLAAGFFVRLSPTNINPEQFVRNIEFDNCTANGNGNGTSNSGGFVILNESGLPLISNVAIEKSVAKFNNGYGVLINGNVPGASINQSELYQNTLGGINIINNTNNVFVSRNTAYLNGVNNYIGVNPSVIIQSDVNNLPTTPGFLNVSVL